MKVLLKDLVMGISCSRLCCNTSVGFAIGFILSCIQPVFKTFIDSDGRRFGTILSPGLKGNGLELIPLSGGSNK